MMRLICVMTVSISLLLFASGCVDREQLKSDVLQSVGQHEKINNYRFSGNANLQLDAPEGALNGNPLTAVLLSMLMNGTLSWEGVASIEPLQVEANLSLKPQGRDTEFTIPLLIKDNKMYIHIPAMNKDDQFFEIDFAALSEISGKTDAAGQPLSESGQLFADIAEEIVSEIDADRFNQEEDSESGEQVITASFEQKHADEAIQAWFRAMPAILDHLAAAGYVTEEKAEAAGAHFNEEELSKWEMNSDSLIFREPAELTFVVNKEGFAREMSFTADLELQLENGITKNYKADVVNRYEDINSNPPFTMEVPEKVTPFTDILKMMQGKQ